MNTVSIITVTLSALYLLLCYSRFGMTKSISATFYYWMDIGYSSLFVAFCLIITLGAWLQGIYPYKHETKFALVIAGLMIFCVGIAATYKDQKVNVMHYVFASLAIILGFVALAIEYDDWRQWLPASVFVVSIPIIRKLWPQWTTYIIEAVAIALIFGFL